MIVGTTTVTQKGQVTLPKLIRERLGIHPGDRVVFEVRKDEAVLRLSNESIVDILRRSGPWGVDAVKFQRKLRAEWKI